MRRLETIPVHLVPAFYQHAYDRILYLRAPEDTPARALKAIGLYNVITQLLARENLVSLATIGREIGMTYQGLLRTGRYLENVGLIEINKLTVPSPFILAKHRAVRRFQEICRDYQNPLTFEQARQFAARDAPAMWHMAYATLLNGRGPDDTAAKVLKCMGLLNVIARMAATDVVVTKAMLAARLDMTAHTLTSQIEYLQRLDLVAIHEQRSRVSNAREYRIDIPEPIVEHANISLRQLQRQLKQPGWEDGARLRQMAAEHRKDVLKSRSQTYVPLAPLKRSSSRSVPHR
ncbi:hypothetical protein [Pannonibacter phragmitetus]|jgi:hypothetical protein|uniref:hypothetical protein n=1 Tax=Pannonibacter phragmitetus TaxID=121719 RepID=UPI000F013CDC|nr:hypothetical protein [Pannonibacter phragmitetus]